MVLGLRSKNRKGNSVEVEYLVHIQEIKPWPPSKSLKSVEAVYLKWESSDQTTGFLTSSVGAGKIEFNNFFRLPLSLRRDGKSKTRDSFQKNCLEFYLYESQKDKAVKGQLLGSAIINISEYGIVKETVSIYTPLNCKKSFRSTVQPVLFVKLQAFDKDSSTSSQTSLSKETSLDKDGSQSASELISEVNDDELEIASITDDDDDYDIRSHSSRTTSSAFKATEGLPSPKEENGSESGKDCNVQPTLHMIAASKKPHRNTGAEGVEHLNGNLSPLPSMELSSDSGNPADNQTSFSKFPERIIPTPEESATYSVKSSSSFLGYLDNNKESDVCTRGFPQNSMAHNVREKVAGESSSRIQEHVSDSLAAKVASTNSYSQMGVDSKHVSSAYSKGSKMDDIKARRQSEPDKEIITTDVLVSLPGKKQQVIGHEEHILKEKKLSSEKDLLIQIPQDTIEKQVTLRSSTLPYGMRALGVQGRNETSNKLQHMKSVQLHSESANYKGIVATNKIMDKTKVVNTQEDAHNTSTSYATSERKETAHGFDNSKSELESRVKMLEEELREAAAIEVGLYSVVAEHGSSVNKVHAPARRLSRYYLHACKSGFEAKQASAARAAVSGLVLVSKACGNDVPRLTFWLSNSIVLREIVSKAVGELPISSGSHIKFNGGGEETQRRFSLKRNQLSSNEEEKNNSVGGSDDWEDPQTFIVALENIEAWIFSRIVESVWWQTLTPYMQSAAAKGSTSRKNSVRRYGLGDQDQVNFSIELWKKAFKDACERLCPIRAGGHECGCLHVLARLVMEQLVNRLDVAMFNAILRESEEEMPTDPMSDPISDSRVLPIPAGKSSFGAGAQLKNAIGNWSRWLTDLFGIDDNDPHEDENNLAGDKRPESEASFKAFHVLNALSDLMMLPWEMLADSSTRKEVCPKFGTPVIKTVLSNFVPDEFCPDPIPESVFEALDSEDSTEAVGESISISSIPVNATPPVYLPPAASVASVIGEFGRQSSTGGSSILKKSYTSDDELDELDSPITSIISENFPVSASSTGPDWMRKAKWGRNVVRYKLLREIWTMEEQ